MAHPAYERTQVLWPLWIVLPATALLTWWLAGSVQSDPGMRWGVAAVALGELLLLAGLSHLRIVVDPTAVRWWYGFFGWPNWTVPLDRIRSVESTRSHWLEGWGIRRTKEGMLYNAGGSGAVRLTLKDGRRLRLGSDEPERLVAFIQARLS